MNLNIIKFLNDLHSNDIHKIDDYFKSDKYNIKKLVLYTLSYSKNEYKLKYILHNFIDLKSNYIKNILKKLISLRCFKNIKILFRSGYEFSNISNDIILKKIMIDTSINYLYYSDCLLKYLYFHEVLNYDEIYYHFRDNPEFYTSKSEKKLTMNIIKYLDNIKSWDNWTKYKNILLIKKRYDYYSKNLENIPKNIKMSYINVLSNTDLMKNISTFI